MQTFVAQFIRPNGESGVLHLLAEIELHGRMMRGGRAGQTQRQRGDCKGTQSVHGLLPRVIALRDRNAGFLRQRTAQFAQGLEQRVADRVRLGIAAFA